MNEKDKLGFLEISSITAIIAAFIGDVAFLFVIGAIIPILGLGVLFFVLLAHYLAGLMVGAFIFSKLKGLIPKLVLAAGIILPLPTLLLSTFLSIILQSEIVQTVVIAAVGAVTGGAGAVAARGAVAAGEVEGAAAGVEGAGAVRTVAGIEKSAGRAGLAEEETAEGEISGKPETERGRREISPEELGEEPEPMERLQRKLLEETLTGGTNEENEEEGVYIDGDEIDLRNAQ